MIKFIVSNWLFNNLQVNKNYNKIKVINFIKKYSRLKKSYIIIGGNKNIYKLKAVMDFK